MVFGSSGLATMRPRFETADLIFVDLWLKKKGGRRGRGNNPGITRTR
jgi:hypothetical protein